MAVAVARSRNIQKTLTFDRERLEVVEAMARGMDTSLSQAVARLVDLQAGKVLEAIEAAEAPVFEIDRWKSRKLTRELVALVAGEVRQGATKADAYRSVEIPPTTGSGWEKQGRDDIAREHPSLYADLVSSMERARAECNMELIQEARRKGDYKTLLKLLDPEQFNPVSRQSVDVTHRFQLVIDWDQLGIEETRTLAALLRKASPLDDHPAITRTARPALEAIPEHVAEIVDAEFDEITEAPALDTQKPDR